jgi:hypothetical protein
MSTSNVVMLAVAAVFLVLYLARRRKRLSADE